MPLPLIVARTSVREQMAQRFSRVLANNLALIKAQKGLIWFTSFFGQAAVVFPFGGGARASLAVPFNWDNSRKSLAHSDRSKGH